MLYLLFIFVAAVLVYAGWRIVHARSTGTGTRVIGPDDDPDFLRRLSNDDTKPPR